MSIVAFLYELLVVFVCFLVCGHVCDAGIPHATVSYVHLIGGGEIEPW